MVGFVEEAPARLERPLGLVEGRGYAATWVYTQVERELVARERRALPAGAGAEVVDRVEAPPDIEAERVVERTVERRLMVVSEDGAAFGEGTKHGLGELGIDLALAEPGRAGRLWRLRGVEAYRRGERPNGADVFEQLVGCYDAFVDFGGSLGPQREMCELGACFSLTTWLADAFPLVPYLWATGERSSGKTQLGLVWALTSYLGEVVLASGSFAALRDLTEQGAALYFDDAEALGEGRHGDRSKRELLLAGNRRGARVVLKVADRDGWRTRSVGAYAPRAFSAIARPEATLGSRAIVVPLARTTDRARGHRDPADEGSWPCDRMGLQDDLWGLGLGSLAEAKLGWGSLDGDELVGREYEKWRPLLAVARLAEGAGVVGLESRVRGLMAGYQDERAELVEEDETVEVVRLLVELLDLVAIPIAGNVTEAARTGDREAAVPNSLLTDLLPLAVPDGALARMQPRAMATRIGQVMARLRFRPARNVDEERERGWVISFAKVLQVAKAYGVRTGPGWTTR